MTLERFKIQTAMRFLICVSAIIFLALSIMTSAAADKEDKENDDDEQFVNYLADFEAIVVTNKGDFTLSFLPDIAPAHVLNFITLAKTGFYDGLTSHRYVPGFVIQGGDPLGNGTGGPGYSLPAEISEKPLHIKGAMGMARTSDEVNPERRSSGSQFYICLDDVHRLDNKYTVWANVSRGMDVVLNLRAGDEIEKIRIRHRGNAIEKDIAVKISALEKEATDPVTGMKYIDEKAVVKTAGGDFEIGFYYSGAPETVASFVNLAHNGEYTGKKFSIPQPGNVIEVITGDEDSIPFEFHPDYKHVKGAVGMMPFKSGEDEEKLSSAGDFYICLDDIPELNGEQTVWGFIGKGMEIVSELKPGDIIDSITIVPLAEKRTGQ